MVLCVVVRLLTVEQAIELLSRRFLHAGEDVAVDVERNADTGMSQSFRDHLGMDTRLEHQRGVCVP